MVKRIVRWSAALLVVLLLCTAGFLAYCYFVPVPHRQFDSAWYHTRRDVTEAAADTFQKHHQWAVLRAQADHFADPVAPGRAVVLYGASSPDESGEVLLYFGSAFVSSSSAFHLLPVYGWSEREERLLWKGLQDNSP